MKNIKTRHYCRFLALAVLAFAPSAVQADTLYVAGGNQLYQINTAVGGGSPGAIASAYGLIAEAIAVDRGGNVFLATWGNGATDFGDIYELTTNGVLLTVATNLNYPACLAVDGHGNLFEGGGLNNENHLNEFINTGGTLSSVPVAFGTGLNLSTSLAFDAGGDLFVSDAGNGNIFEFTNTVAGLSANPTTTPFSDYGAGNLAFDSSGDLFIGYSGGSILEFVNGSGILSSTATVLSTVIAENLAFDSHDNLFYVDNTGVLNEFVNNAGTLSSTPTPLAGDLNASSLAFLPVATPRLYVAAYDNSEVEEYEPGFENIYSFDPTLGAGSQRVIASGLDYEPWVMAADSRGNLFLADGFSTIYEIPRNGVQVVFASGLSNPRGLAFDANDNLFEADNGTSIIYEFTNNAGTLSTNATVFSATWGYANALAFDGRGNLWVANISLDYPVEFPNTGGVLSSSNQFISVTEQGTASSVAFDSNGNLFAGYGTYGYSAVIPSGSGILENVNNNSAAWYNGGILSPSPGIIANNNANSLACDLNGNLYAADGDTGNLYQYPNNAGTLSLTPNLFAASLGVACVAMNINASTPVAPAPNLYVSGNYNDEGGGSSGIIYGFNTTNGASSQTIVAGNLDTANYAIGSVAFDNQGNLFISGGINVYELTNQAGTLTSNLIYVYEGGIGQTAGASLAFDNGGSLFVADFHNFCIDEFTYTGVPGVWSSAYGASYFLGSGGITLSLTFASNGNLFSANGGITEYGNMSGPRFSQTILTFGNFSARSLAFDHGGNLFAGSNDGNIYEFTNSINGLSTNALLFASGLNTPAALVFDAGGNLFEADSGSGEINEFINSYGTLSSTPVVFASGLDAPVGLAIYSPSGAPTLTIAYLAPTTNNVAISLPARVIVSWPSTAAGYVLQTNTTSGSLGWANYTGTVDSNLGINSVTVFPLVGNLFFRLFHQ